MNMHGLRTARDLDFIIDPTLFAELEKQGWKRGRQGSASYALENGDAEVWADWSTDGSGQPDYAALLPYTEVRDGVRMVTLDYLVQRKLERNTEKDRVDVEAITKYMEAAK